MAEILTASERSGRRERGGVRGERGEGTHWKNEIKRKNKFVIRGKVGKGEKKKKRISFHPSTLDPT